MNESLSGNVALSERTSAVSPLVKDFVCSRNMSSSYQLHNDLNSRDIWSELLPPQFHIIRYCIEKSPFIIRALSIIYVMSSLSVFIAIYFAYSSQSAQSNSTFIASIVFQLVETLVVIILPPVAFVFIRDVFACEDLPDLFITAAAFDPFLSIKFKLVALINAILLLASILLFAVLVPMPVYQRVCYAMLSLFYLMPFCYMYTIVLFILEAHRQSIEQFLVVLRNHIPSWHQYATGQQQQKTFSFSSLNDLRRQYIKLHYHCRTTSMLRGKHILFLFCVALTLIIYTIWSLYGSELMVVALVLYIVASLITLHEVGGLLASTNEAGNIVCRELSALLLYWDAQSDAPLREITVLLQCINYAKLEIPFFGNFVLRPRTLFALAGSALAAIIPGFLLR